MRLSPFTPSPPAMSTRPLGSNVAVWSERGVISLLVKLTKGASGRIVQFRTAEGITRGGLSTSDEGFAVRQHSTSHGHPRSSHGSGGSPCSSGWIVEFGRRGHREVAIYVIRGAAASN